MEAVLFERTPAHDHVHLTSEEYQLCQLHDSLGLLVFLFKRTLQLTVDPLLVSATIIAAMGIGGHFTKNDKQNMADYVVHQMGEQVTELVKIEIDDLEGYVSAVIEKTLAELKGQI